ncbi:uncharacterized protein AC631_05957 [Debaryomyces fabryi]|uniref:Uncharacterized protein n=1 Tax=Debaryomyces fabryi TaxID=58627 RepID=A0A0V1PQ38_9ASCO|nr:uncharacterized protein AC631_05957 [Debaryomyces fabryi]KRZ98282.1 hypothetical protein AC631_05957 [Debaryomyces fabryi]
MTNPVPNKPTTMTSFVPPHTTSSAVARPPTVETFEDAAIRGDPLSAAILSAIFSVILSIF